MSKNSIGRKAAAAERREERKPGTSTIEWIVAGLSCLMLGAVIAYLVFDAFSGRNGPARLAVTLLGVTAGENGHIVEFSAENSAGSSAAGVEITGELRRGSEVVEESSVTLDYLPQKSESKGVLIFRNDPKAHELRLFATGYIEP